MQGTRAASLGQLAVRAKIIPKDKLRRLREALRSRALSGKPVSMGRLLLKGGLTSKGLRRLLRSGVDMDAVTCDSCAVMFPQSAFPDRKEYPCTKCGALLLGFAVFKKGALKDRSSGGNPALPEEPPPELMSTQTFHQVMPIPGSLDSATPIPIISTAGEDTTLNYDNPEGSTVHFRNVLDTPTPARPPRGGSTNDLDYIYEIPSGVGRLSEEETLMAMSELVRESADPKPKPKPKPRPKPKPAPPGPPGVANRDLAGTEDAGASMVRQLGLRRIGEFTLLEPLGKGAVGRVFLAQHDESGRRVALKVLRSESARDPEIVRRFEREARVSGLVKHPNVVELVGAGADANGTRYLALEYLDGGSLLDILREENKVKATRALEIVRGVCLALQAAKAHGIVHRDIKPENIMFSTAGRPKLADLGLAKILEGQTQITETGFVVGTPCYIAPEQATGQDDIDIRADLFALGFCLWQMLTGVVPFSDDEDAAPMDVIVRHLEEDLPDPRLYNPEISDSCAQIVRGMTARERKRRYPSPAHVIRDIDLVLAGEAPLSSSTHTLPPALQELVKRLNSSASGGAHASLAQTVDTDPPRPALLKESAPQSTVKKQGSGAACAFAFLLGLAAFGAFGVWAAMWIHYWSKTDQLPF